MPFCQRPSELCRAPWTAQEPIQMIMCTMYSTEGCGEQCRSNDGDYRRVSDRVVVKPAHHFVSSLNNICWVCHLQKKKSRKERLVCLRMLPRKLRE